MMKSLYSGVAGLKTHQTKMDVIGNNIANVNTAAYKSQRVNFADVYYNTANVGYGSKVSSIDTVHTLSGYSPTDVSTDLYISGDGYFSVENANNETLYTRNGAFKFDSTGNLIDASGNNVLGWSLNGDSKLKVTDDVVDISGTIADTVDPSAINIAAPDDVTFTNITINTDGTITATYNYTGTDATSDKAAKDDTIVTIGLVGVATIPNPNALVLEGNSNYALSKDTGEPTYYVAGTGGSGEVIANALEMSNVDLAGAFTDMITTQRGFQANSKIITTVDEMLEALVNLKR